MFTKAEIGTICYFFGTEFTDEVFELSEFYTLEDGYINHPSGDRLAVTATNYVVYLSDGTEEHHYHRDFPDLVAAMEKLTLRDI